MQARQWRPRGSSLTTEIFGFFCIFGPIFKKIELSHCTDTVRFPSFFSHYRLSDCTRSKIVIFQPIYPIFFNVGRDLSFKGAKICQATLTAAAAIAIFLMVIKTGLIKVNLKFYLKIFKY